jgi:hypothetical protein
LFLKIEWIERGRLRIEPAFFWGSRREAAAAQAACSYEIAGGKAWKHFDNEEG